jgi:hypothetical protein
MQYATAIFAVAIFFASTALADSAPLLGLYTCTEPSGYPDMTSYFGLLDSSTYANSEGAKGEYKFDHQSSMISMTSGPLAGSSYKRIPGTNSFLKQHREMALSCPYSSRDPRHYPW